MAACRNEAVSLGAPMRDAIGPAAIWRPKIGGRAPQADERGDPDAIGEPACLE